MNGVGYETRDWWWLSFVDTAYPEPFRGACVVRGSDMADAVKEAHRKGCNPGGQVEGANLSEVGLVETDPTSPLNEYGANRLIPIEELYAHGERKEKDLPESAARILDNARDAGAIKGVHASCNDDQR